MGGDSMGRQLGSNGDSRVSQKMCLTHQTFKKSSVRLLLRFRNQDGIVWTSIPKADSVQTPKSP